MKAILFIFCLLKIAAPSPVSNGTFLKLNDFVRRLDEFAPPETASTWDNTGLLVEPTGDPVIKKVLVTNDLNRPVLKEAIEKDVDMIISYHPPMVGMVTPHTFLTPLTRLTQKTWKQEAMVKCIENRIAVYSPHTTWDSIDGGINDWILSVFNTTRVESILKTRSPETISKMNKSVKLYTFNQYELQDYLAFDFESENVKVIAVNPLESALLEDRENTEIEFLANDNGVLDIKESIEKFYGHEQAIAKKIFDTMRVYDLEKPLMRNVGLGRIGYLAQKMPMSEIVLKMKHLLDQKTFRIALAYGKTINDTVSVLAIGAGKGTGLLSNTVADFIITGELTHHDILHETHRGTSILITDHSNTERGFINDVFKPRFSELLARSNERVEIIVSETDRDPIEYI